MPEVVAGPIAELHPAGEDSDVVERGEGADGLGVTPFGARTLNLDGVLLPKCSALGFRAPLLGIWIVIVDAGELDIPFTDAPNGWKPFIVVSGNSSIRRLGFRRVGDAAWKTGVSAVFHIYASTLVDKFGAEEVAYDDL